MSGGGHENNSSDTDSDTEEYLSNVHRYLSTYMSLIHRVNFSQALKGGPVE